MRNSYVKPVLWLAVVAFLLGHLFFLARSLEDIDSVNFALGVRSYDIGSHQPTFKGEAKHICAQCFRDPYSQDISACRSITWRRYFPARTALKYAEHTVLPMSKLSQLTRNSLIVAFFFGLDKVLAFVRTGIISRQYRHSVGMLDTFNAANNLPDVLFALISGGALAMAFIPLLSEYITTKDRAAAWDLFSRVANIAFLVTASIAVIIALFAEPIVEAEIGIAAGLDAEQRHLLADLMRLNLIGTIIFSISGLVMASLQANQHCVLPALAPTMYNVGQIIGALFFVPRFGIHGRT